MMKDETFLAGLSIVSLSILEAAAIIAGLDGAFFMPICGLIAGIGGAGIGYKYAKTSDNSTLQK